MSVYEINNESFENEVINEKLPVVVDFWASWCAPCKMTAPVVEAASRELEGKVKFCKVNVDEEPELARKYRITSIPTLMVFKGGDMVRTGVGAADKNKLLSLLDLE